jgi:hypothetical protein
VDFSRFQRLSFQTYLPAKYIPSLRGCREEK